MNKDSLHHNELLEKWVKGEASPAEVTEVMDFIARDESLRPLLQVLNNRFYGEGNVNLAADTAGLQRIRGELLQLVQKEQPLVLVKPRRQYWRWAAAAVLVILLGLVFFWNRGEEQNDNSPIVNRPAPSEIAPGTQSAVLTLADGTVINLGADEKPVDLRQGYTTITTGNNQLVYREDKLQSNATTLFNTLSAGRGQSYSLVLSDGSKLWLNAASSVRFPVSFDGNERRIELSGQVYLEVAQDPLRPFRIQVNEMELEVLGTSFDVSAYPDEANIVTTLLEGSVLVKTNKHHMQLRPGQQSLLSPDGNLLMKEVVNLEEVIAWKNGFFHFDNAGLGTILRQFARWYDIEVIYEGPMSDRKFFAIVNRNNQLTDVLKMLQANNIRFRIEGKKLYVQSDGA